jgi:hypothetical protein
MPRAFWSPNGFFKELLWSLATFCSNYDLWPLFKKWRFSINCVNPNANHSERGVTNLILCLNLALFCFPFWLGQRTPQPQTTQPHTHHNTTHPHHERWKRWKRRIRWNRHAFVDVHPRDPLHFHLPPPPPHAVSLSLSLSTLLALAHVIHAHIYVCVYTHTHTHTYIYIYIYTYNTCVYICVYIYIYIFICIYIT